MAELAVVVMKRVPTYSESKPAAFNKDIVFNNLGYIIDIEILKEILNRLNGKRAIGID